jgi:hypothetical protein
MLRKHAKLLVAVFFMAMLASQVAVVLGNTFTALNLIPIVTATIGSLAVYLTPNKIPAKPPLREINDIPEWASTAWPGKHAKVTDD